MRIFERFSGGRFPVAAALAAIVLASTVGCFSFGQNDAGDEPTRPTVRQVRAEWREMERNGLLPLLEDPLAPDEDFSARFDPDEYRALSHPRETQAALELLRETVAQLEDEKTRETFLSADRERDPTRTEALQRLFASRYEDRVAGTTVWVEWDRLFQAFGELEQDDWVKRQRLYALEAMLQADAPSTVPPLLKVLPEEAQSDDRAWRTLIANFPGPATPDGRSLWMFIQAEVEPEGAVARGLLDRLTYETSLSGVPHPFADQEGHAKLRKCMESDDPQDFGLKKAILGNAKHFPVPFAEELYAIGEKDPSPLIQIEALYRACESASQERRIRRLVGFCDDERYAATARDRLFTLGKGYRAREATDPLQASREQVYQTVAALRGEVDATPEELTLLVQGTVPWDEEGEEIADVYVYSYRLPDVALIAKEDSTSAEEIYPTAYESTRGYAVTFLGGTYVYSVEEARQQKCETTLDLAAMVHRDYMAYELDAADGLTPVPEYAANLIERDWRWGELRVPLEFEEESSSD